MPGFWILSTGEFSVAMVFSEETLNLIKLTKENGISWPAITTELESLDVDGLDEVAGQLWGSAVSLDARVEILKSIRSDPGYQGESGPIRELTR